MKKLLLIGLAVLSLSGCMTTRPALTVAGEELQAYPVKGRQGLLINQKLSFGDFQTSKVKRSWTKGGESQFGIPVGKYNQNFLSLEGEGKGQDFYFEMGDSLGNSAQAFAFSEFASEDVVYTQNSSDNKRQNTFEFNLNSKNLFYLQLWLQEEVAPWELILDNEAAQITAKEYEGIFSRDDENFYVLKPITKVEGKKGPEDLLLGSIGYEIFNNQNQMVAAVSLVDSGDVYFNTGDPKEKFLLANLCAALLLQENIAEF